MLSVRSNPAATAAAFGLARAQRGLSRSLERVSSGRRINRAADDAAGLGVATSLETSVISARQAIRNANDGLSIVQTAESAASEVTDILQRMRELVVQSASDTLADDERAYIQTEWESMWDEIERIAVVTEYNGLQLADSSISTIAVQVGIQSDTDSRIDIQLGHLGTLNLLGATGAYYDISTADGARLVLDNEDIDSGLDKVNQIRAHLGAVHNRITSSINSSEQHIEAAEAARSQIEDTDFAAETATLTRQQILQQAGIASLAQARNISEAVLALI